MSPGVSIFGSCTRKISTTSGDIACAERSRKWKPKTRSPIQPIPKSKRLSTKNEHSSINKTPLKTPTVRPTAPGIVGSARSISDSPNKRSYSAKNWKQKSKPLRLNSNRTRCCAAAISHSRCTRPPPLVTIRQHHRPRIEVPSFRTRSTGDATTNLTQHPHRNPMQRNVAAFGLRTLLRLLRLPRLAKTPRLAGESERGCQPGPTTPD